MSILGQDAAGGCGHGAIRRESSFRNLGEWWAGRAGEDAPAVARGFEGVGKTWATLDWLVASADRRVGS